MPTRDSSDDGSEDETRLLNCDAQGSLVTPAGWDVIPFDKLPKLTDPTALRGLKVAYNFGNKYGWSIGTLHKYHVTGKSARRKGGAKWEFRWDDTGISEKERFYFMNMMAEVKRYGLGAEERICLFKPAEVDSEDETIASLCAKATGAKRRILVSSSESDDGDAAPAPALHDVPDDAGAPDALDAAPIAPAPPPRRA